MKKFSLILAFVLILSLTSCKSNNAPSPTDESEAPKEATMPLDKPDFEDAPEKEEEIDPNNPWGAPPSDSGEEEDVETPSVDETPDVEDILNSGEIIELPIIPIA